MYDPQDASDIWSKIPDDTDVLITHGPPYGVLDQCPDTYGAPSHAGCPELCKAVEKIPSIKLHVFGHIHEGYGQVDHQNGRVSVNASVVYMGHRRPPVGFILPAHKQGR